MSEPKLYRRSDNGSTVRASKILEIRDTSQPNSPWRPEIVLADAAPVVMSQYWHGVHKPQPGMWLVADECGSVTCVADESFGRIYELAE
ncbi:MAG: hypothetical protein KIH64_006300 [Mycobacterium sp.]|nr:hypothetical protein [Mycobacterium sp.]